MIRTIASFMLALSLSAAAQKSKIDVRFLAERLPKGLENVTIATEKSLSEPFALPTNNLSKSQQAPARNFVLRPEGSEKTLTKIALPENGNAFIILLIPSPEKGYEPVVMPADSPDFGPGDVYFYNYASKTILGYVGTAKFILPPKKGKALRPKGAREEGFYDVGFGVREKDGDRALSNTRWPVDERLRSFVFFFTNPKTQLVDYRAVDDFVPVKDPAG